LYKNIKTMDKLKNNINTLIKNIQEQDVEIARLEGYLKGHEDGFDTCKGKILSILSDLPESVLNEEGSVINLINELNEALFKIKDLKRVE
jgi:hypothetical protein